MLHKAVIRDGAKEDFKDIKRSVKKEVGDSVWNKSNAEYKAAFDLIKNNLRSGSSMLDEYIADHAAG